MRRIFEERTSIKLIAVCVITLTAISLATRLTRQPRPVRHVKLITAETSVDFLSAALLERKDQVKRELRTHVTSSTSYPQIRAQWENLRTSMILEGASEREVDIVLSNARRRVPVARWNMPMLHWPVSSLRGTIGHTEMWAVICAWPRPADKPYATQPTDPALDPKKLGYDYYVIAVDPTIPDPLGSGMLITFGYS